jgi:signal transduction histidine kinase/CheY-like chemotaxis protein
VTLNSIPERRKSPEGRSALGSARADRAEVTGSSDHFEVVFDPSVRRIARRQRTPLSQRAKWTTVIALAAAHPALLLVLHPIVGEASNSLLLVGPVVATLLFSLRMGVLFIFVNTIASGFVFTHFGMSGEEGLPKAAISLLVTLTVCWGAERLRFFIEQRRAMEENLHHAQKVEAIGRLAAGVAHDINNTLNAIMGSAFALRHELASYGRSFQDLDNIALACDRGAQLTRNLLGFARKGRSRTESVSLNAVAREVQLLVTRTGRKNIRVETRLAEPTAVAQGDEAQVEHAVLNLCLNALDAMGDEGTLTVATETHDDTVLVSVSDTGTGMDPQVLQHAFEPFFTTKPVGKGTGLGLSMVYGTVQAMHGTVTVSTTLGAGTTITLKFPRASNPATAPSTSPARSEPRSLAGSTILVIDDEPLVLRATVRMLRAMGCQVLSANSGREGVEAFRTHRDSVSLVVVDLVMPDSDGVVTLNEMLDLAPQTPILLVSGYSPEADRVDALLSAHPTVAYLEKPYDPNTIAAALSRLLPAELPSTPSSRRTGTE